ncbi:MAG: molybdopterin-dependent oxidoreductase [Candidatus Hodarchaeales archaeon]
MNFLLIILFLGIMGRNISIKADNEEIIPITSNEEFFITSVDYFELRESTYRLEVVGNVRNPLNLTLDEIKELPVSSEIVRLTCIAYKNGATSMTGVANWTGVKLSEVLILAQINLDTAFDVIFRTSDHSLNGYSTSLTVEEAFWDDVILAYEMNGVPLPIDHGFPIRLVCPRFFGYKWIKWLTHINVSSSDYLGYWERFDAYDDSPYFDLDLQVYYPFDGTTSIISNKPGWFGIEILVVLVLFSSVPIYFILRKVWKIMD